MEPLQARELELRPRPILSAHTDDPVGVLGGQADVAHRVDFHALDTKRVEGEYHRTPAEASMEPVVSRPDSGLNALRQLRAELRESIDALELALASPAVGRVEAWAERVSVALGELSADFRTHIAITEGPESVHREVLEVAPRLSNAVGHLAAEHAVITALIEDLLNQAGNVASKDDVDAIRDLATGLLGRLARHRQRGADLIYEAYETDIGGET